jgi:hypothetical protein
MRIRKTIEDSAPRGETQPLVDAEGLLRALFPPSCRPSRRWLDRQKKAKQISFIRLGGLIFYSPEKVRRELEERQTVRGGAR